MAAMSVSIVVKEESFCATDAENSSRFAVRGEAERLEHIPLREVVLDLVDVAPEALQDLEKILTGLVYPLGENEPRQTEVWMTGHPEVIRLTALTTETFSCSSI
jgi:hypothetical protein